MGPLTTVQRHHRQFKEAVLAAWPSVQVTWPDGPSALARDEHTNWSPTDQEEDDRFWLAYRDKVPEHLTLAHARELEALCRRHELPGFVSYGVLDELVRGQKGRWRAAALDCLEGVAEELRSLAEAVVNKHFEQFPLAKAVVG